MAVSWRLALACITTFVVASAPAAADIVTNQADASRTGWYPDQAGLNHDRVTAADFGQLFSQPVDGQVYAQPLVADGKLLVATEANQVYALNPITGAPVWHRDLGPAFDPTDGDPISCSDLTPTVGVTSTPVVDTATSTEYLTSKAQDGTYTLHALSTDDGSERAGFPVVLDGYADNHPSVGFTGAYQLQRPGLLLQDGVIYLGFGGHCDQLNYQGWVFGVSTSGQVRTRWVDVDQVAGGAGIWQAGSGLTSDGQGGILLATGNAFEGSTPGPGPIPGDTPPPGLGESVVHLVPDARGVLRATDFFAPSNAATLDDWDADLASGGPVALPAAFGTSRTPHLLAVAGKMGQLFTLDRDDLGGFKQGPDGGDAVVDAAPGAGQVFGKPSVWSGAGGYAFVPRATGPPGGRSDGGLEASKRTVGPSGSVSLVRCAMSAEGYGQGTGSPVITSDATTPGSGLVWVTTMADRSGAGSQLRVYDADPTCGQDMTQLRSWPIGRGTKYASPGLGAGRLYVGTADGHVLGFGAPAQTPLETAGAAFGTVTVGSPAGGKTQAVTLTSTEDGLRVTGVGLDAPAGDFRAATVAATDLDAGQALDVPVTYTPTRARLGSQGATLRVHLSRGGVALDDALVSLSARGQAAGGALVTAPHLVAFGAAPVRASRSATVTLTNQGATALRVTGVQLPGGPVSVSGLPAVPFSIASGHAVPLTLTFSPPAPGDFSGTLAFTTDGQETSDQDAIGLTGTAAAPGLLTLSPATSSLDLGSVPLGDAATQAVQLTNTGGTSVVLNRFKPPIGQGFSLDPGSGVDEGSSLPPGATRTLVLRYAPTALGPQSGLLSITADDGAGVHDVRLTGTGVASPMASNPDPPATATAPSPEPPPSPEPAPDGTSDAAPAPAPAPTPRPARLTQLKVTPNAVTARRPATISFVVDRATRVRLTVRRATGARPFARGSLSAATVGVARVRLRFAGRLGGRALRPGRYTLVATPAGGTPVRRAFSVAG